MAFAPTAQQSAFLTALTTTTSHLALIARAGCGKTSTILLGMKALALNNPRGEYAVFAYNKAIADEVSAKLKAMARDENIPALGDWKTVQAGTLHSAGFGLLRFVFKPQIEENKVRNLVDALNSDIAREYSAQVVKLVGYAKGAGVGFFPDMPINSVQVWHDLADHFDVNGLDDTSEMEDIVEVCQQVYRQSLAQTDVIDFDDMILFPLIKNLRVKFGKDVIFLDEAQDLSRARQALARKFLKPSGRLVIVGDDRQAIYGFSGADAAALDNLVQSMNATVLPLSITWRCPKAVVSLAQTIVPDIEAAPTAPEGVVSTVHLQDEAAWASLASEFTPEDAILCRNTAPLISMAYKLIRAKIACKVEGRDIGKGLTALINRWKVKTTEALSARVEAYRQREVQKAQARNNDAKAEQVNDKCDTICEIIRAVNANGLHTVADVANFINDLFSDDVKGVLTLATYHRAKGREWGNVYLFEHHTRCPSKAARQDWQRLQEDNLAYVAITRAMRTLTFIS
jgi:DNA helicase-2/ATP-dependent DNA helicase PcrA